MFTHLSSPAVAKCDPSGLNLTSKTSPLFASNWLIFLIGGELRAVYAIFASGRTPFVASRIRFSASIFFCKSLSFAAAIASAFAYSAICSRARKSSFQGFKFFVKTDCVCAAIANSPKNYLRLRCDSQIVTNRKSLEIANCAKFAICGKLRAEIVDFDCSTIANFRNRNLRLICENRKKFTSLVLSSNARFPFASFRTFFRAANKQVAAPNARREELGDFVSVRESLLRYFRRRFGSFPVSCFFRRIQFATDEFYRRVPRRDLFFARALPQLTLSSEEVLSILPVNWSIFARDGRFALIAPQNRLYLTRREAKNAILPLELFLVAFSHLQI